MALENDDGCPRTYIPDQDVLLQEVQEEISRARDENVSTLLAGVRRVFHYA